MADVYMKPVTPEDRAVVEWIRAAIASGKTCVGLELARRIGAEIVSMDSMALYRGMDIGTAKPTLFQCGNVPHHLIDLIEPHEEFSLAQYLEAARTSVDQIRTRGRDVLFVGGTPLYLKGLLRGIFRGPPADWELRKVDGTLINQDLKVGEAGLTDGLTLFLTPRAGAGG